MSVYSGPANWWTEGTDAGRSHIATKGIVQANLVLNLDAGVTSSYSGSGANWVDLEGINANTTLSLHSFDSGNGGTIVFNNASAILNGSVSIPLAGSTISFWVYLDPTIDWNTRFDIFANDIPIGTQGRLIFYRFDATTLRLQVSFPSLTVYGANVTGANTSFTGKWKHVTITNNTVSTTTTVNIYIDGQFYTTISVPEAATATSTGILMMRNSSAGTYPTKGKLATVGIYNRALSETEILLNFNALRGRFGI